MTKILQKDEPVLRQVAEPVPPDKIKSAKIQSVLEAMREALYKEDDGVAIAAPQIGESLRIFMVKGAALNIGKKSSKKKRAEEKDLVFINPEITKASQKKMRVEEGCLSVRWLYGKVLRSEKVSLRAYNEKGELLERGASGLLAQIFQHEVDHLNGVLFIDKAEGLEEIPPPPKFVFFGSLSEEGPQFANYVLEELENLGFHPSLMVTNAREPLPIEKLEETDADVFVVASFGKILPKSVIDMPKRKTLNIHPSLLPELRGAAPIQNAILGKGKPGITIIRMDEKMDHGPIVAQLPLELEPWPDHYHIAEEKLGRIGGRILAEILPKWVKGEIKEVPQDDSQATFTKLVEKEDGLLDLEAPAEENYRKVLAYSTWPGAYFFHKRKDGKEIRVVVKDATIENGIFTPLLVIPAGKKLMNWKDFLRGN